MGSEGAIMLAPEIIANGVLATVTINTFALPIQDIKTKAKLDLSGKSLGVEDAIIIAALIPLNVSTKRFNCCCLLILLYYNNAKGALTSLNISKNKLVSFLGDGSYDMTGVKALAAAIPECK